jgi:hypothetical protein
MLQKAVYEREKSLTETITLLKSAKDKITSQEERIAELVTQSDKLGVRAAIPFDELTPRYKKFPEFFTEFDMNFWKEHEKPKHKRKKIKKKKNEPVEFVDPFTRVEEKK